VRAAFSISRPGSWSRSFTFLMVRLVLLGYLSLLLPVLNQVNNMSDAMVPCSLSSFPVLFYSKHLEDL
jgi:hypothetical protein